MGLCFDCSAKTKSFIQEDLGDDKIEKTFYCEDHYPGDPEGASLWALRDDEGRITGKNGTIHATSKSRALRLSGPPFTHLVGLREDGFVLCQVPV